jgi:hypothetical protein
MELKDLVKKCREVLAGKSKNTPAAELFEALGKKLAQESAVNARTVLLGSPPGGALGELDQLMESSLPEYQQVIQSFQLKVDEAKERGVLPLDQFLTKYRSRAWTGTGTVPGITPKPQPGTGDVTNAQEGTANYIPGGFGFPTPIAANVAPALPWANYKGIEFGPADDFAEIIQKAVEARRGGGGRRRSGKIDGPVPVPYEEEEKPPEEDKRTLLEKLTGSTGERKVEL